MYQWDEDGDLVVQWDPVKRIELPMLRDGPHDRPACWSCDKIPEKVRQRKQLATSRADALDLSERNRQVWLHYGECQATGHWPLNHDGTDVDPHVKRHARIIAGERREYESGKMDTVITALSLLGRK